MDVLKMVWMLLGPEARKLLIDVAIAFAVWTVVIFSVGVLIGKWLLA